MLHGTPAFIHPLHRSRSTHQRHRQQHAAATGNRGATPSHPSPFPPNLSPLTSHLSSLTPNLSPLTSNPSPQLVHIAPSVGKDDCRGIYEWVREHADDNTILVVDNIRKHNKTLWKHIVQDDQRATVTFDLSTGRGIVSFDSKRVKQNYLL